VRGPLNIARPIQGWPVIVQAGASEAGRQLAAETAEVVFGAGNNIANTCAFYADVKSSMEKLGRSDDHMKILPGAFVVVGETVTEAREKRARLDSLVLRQRNRLAFDRARPRCVGLRSTRPAVENSRKQREPECTREDRGTGAAGEPDGAAARAACRWL
jgi:alkanesulfonate monooxygenase SsuD/methylene tetrahydromethanopterin reductase-like flavin-dependent oxidoreductase (luciferase family)